MVFFYLILSKKFIWLLCLYSSEIPHFYITALTAPLAALGPFEWIHNYNSVLEAFSSSEKVFSSSLPFIICLTSIIPGTYFVIGTNWIFPWSVMKTALLLTFRAATLNLVYTATLITLICPKFPFLSRGLFSRPLLFNLLLNFLHKFSFSFLITFQSSFLFAFK